MIVQMRSTADCEESSLATAAGVSYDEAKAAIGKSPCLPEGANDPLFGNPINVGAAIERLGFKAVRRKYSDIIGGIAAKGKTMVLLHNPSAPTLSQHWVVFADRSQTHVSFHWGDGTQKSFSNEKFLDLFTKGFPNAAWEVGPAEGKIGRLQQVLNWFKGLFRKR